MKFKKTLSLILAAILLVSVASFAAFAVEPEEENYVARMYICSRLVFFGHVWLYFENLTDHDITVGSYTLPPKQGVTVSAYNLGRSDGNGNYYNIDAYCLNKYGSSGTACASMEITEEQLQTVTNQLLSRNAWTVAKNCCHVAGTIWNSVSPRKITIILLPLLMWAQIKSIHCKTPKFYVPTKEQCLKQVGTGENATLKQCSGASYNWFIG